MKKWAMCLAWVLIAAMLLTGCGETPADQTDNTTTTTTAGKADVAIKGTIAGQNGGTTAGGQNGGTTVGGQNGGTTAGGNKTTAGGNKTTAGRGQANKGNKTTGVYNKDDIFGSVSTQKVETKVYNVKATGSKYATGIKLPKLTKKQAKISYMTNTTWDYIKNESSEGSPTAIYHAGTIWKSVYGVDIEIEMVDWGNFTSYLMTSVVAGEGPDVMRWVSGRPKWIQNSLVTPLDDKLDLTDPDYDFEAMENASSMYGHVYAAFSQGIQTPSAGIAYNKTKFEEAGVEDPMSLYKRGKWNWDTFVSTAAAMTDAANNEYGVAGTGMFYPSSFGLMSLNKDGTVTLHVKDSRFVKSMQAVWKLYRVENAARRTDDARSTFPLGQDAMYPTALKEYGRMMDTAKAKGTKDEFGVVPMPVYNFLGHKNPVGKKSEHLEGFSISSVPKNLEGAIEFVRLLTKVGSNISRGLGEFGWVKAYLSNEEKEVFRNVKYTTIGVNDCTNCIDGTNEPYNNVFKYPIYLNANTTQELPSLLASAYSTFNGIITEYEINAGLRS